MDATCRTCPFWTQRSPDHNRGLCHHASNEAADDDALLRIETWWCSEHPARQRDRLAAMAMQGMLANMTCSGAGESVARAAYIVADAMLAARGETP